MRRVKLNTHVVASVNLCAWNRIRDTSRNGRHEISGASACRCRSCRPRPMHGTLIRFLQIGNFMSVLHIVEARWWSEWKGKISWLHKWYLSYESDCEWLLLSFRASSGEYMDISIKTLGFSSLRKDIEYFIRWTNLFTLTFINIISFLDKPPSANFPLVVYPSWSFARLSKMVHNLIHSSETKKKGKDATVEACFFSPVPLHH